MLFNDDNRSSILRWQPRAASLHSGQLCMKHFDFAAVAKIPELQLYRQSVNDFTVFGNFWLREISQV